MKHTLRIAFVFLLAMAVSRATAQINTDHVMMMGRNALYYDDYVLSIQRFNMVINAKPFLAEPYYFRGLAKFYLEDYTGAEQDLTKAVERNPYTESFYELRGLCRVNLERYDIAEQDYRKATALNPMNVSCWHNMALCQLEQKAYGRADSSLNLMIRQWPKRVENYLLKTQIAFAESDTMQALGYIKQALDIDEFSGQAWSMQAMVSANRGHYKEAEEELSKAIVQLPRNANLFINRALARYHLDNLRGAMSDYDTALEIEPGNYLGHFNRGLLRAQVAEDNRAIEDFNFVLEQEPTNTIALYNRALLLDRTGDYKGALRDISTVLNDYPEFWAGYTTRAGIRRKVGDVYGAERDEFTVMKANIEKRTGTYRPKQRATRKKEDVDPSKYDRLVVEDTQSEQQYASDYRGRVQERAAALQPMPPYVLSYYIKGSNVGHYVAYHAVMDELNKRLPSIARLTNNPAGVTAENLDIHFGNIRVLTSRIQRKRNLTDSYVQRAMEYYHVRDFQAAVADMDSAILHSGDDAMFYFLRAQCLYAQVMANSQNADAKPEAQKMHTSLVKRDLDRVIELLPDLAYAHYNLGNVLLSEGNYAQAAMAYTRALELESRFPDAYYNRGVCYLQMGQKDRGIADLSQAGEYGLYSAYSLIKQYSKDKK